MKKLALGLCLAGLLAACGGDDGPVVQIDAPPNPNIDAPGGPCDPLAPAGQQGCEQGQKCTWITIQDTPESVGKIGCVADGTVDLAGSCTNGPAGETTGFDNCKAGNICVGGTCKDVCGFGGGANEACAAGQACTRYADLWANGEDEPLYGACNPTCNPVTQMRSDGTTCGMNQGCYLLVSNTTSTAVCAGAGDVAHKEEITGQVFANSCVPGAQPRRRDGTTQVTECGGLCAPKDVFVTDPANADSGARPAPKAANLVTNFDAEAGDRAVKNCEVHWLADPVSNNTSGEGCRYWWAREPFDDLSPFSNTVGWCFTAPNFQYDSNADQTPDAPFPRCAALSSGDKVPPVSNPPGDDATYFWCKALPAMLQTSIKHVKKDIEIRQPKLDRLGGWR
jgi:hypothetical protein